MSPAGQVLPLSEKDGGGRYPGFDVLGQQDHWDEATRAVVTERLAEPPAITFFSADEVETARALTDQLLHQDAEPRVPVVNHIDARLAAGSGDGYRYATMPSDADAWRASLAALDADARSAHDVRFHALDAAARDEILMRVRDAGHDEWHGLPAARVWSLWTRYACAAFYAHPWAWQEIGFAGPAYPRGYKNRRPQAGGMSGREPFEVADARPGEDPVAAERASSPIVQPSSRHGGAR